eukprot:3733112-Rhodomonas_salina.1
MLRSITMGSKSATLTTMSGACFTILHHLPVTQRRAPTLTHTEHGRWTLVCLAAIHGGRATMCKLPCRRSGRRTSLCPCRCSAVLGASRPLSGACRGLECRPAQAHGKCLRRSCLRDCECS